MKFYEHYKRSLAKTLTFRFMILLIDFLIIIAITKRYDIALTVILFSNLSSTIIYFVHERIWNKIHWGKDR
ncbi:MAG: DUF2061 domain-containing protein [Candidatus Levybacteria bacterium]|nr:DUF2061 domain-containing protein [Candidatus Levybacteria bacterium]MBI4009053.1 DUF2061 domain-containing protein [Candidatus Roizmanbacteria bacterium]